jgi:hypothetical protein
VTIDPTVSFTTGAVDCTIANGGLNGCTSAQLGVGYNGSSATYRSLIEWPSSVIHASVPWAVNTPAHKDDAWRLRS